MGESLDVRTLMVMMGSVNIALAAIMVTLAATRRTYLGFGLWTAAFVSAAVGSALISMRGAAPDLLTMVIGNLCIAAFPMLMARGLAVFTDEKQAPLFEAVVLVACAGAMFYTAYVDRSTSLRIVFVMGTFLVFTLRVGWVAFRGVPKSLGRTDWHLWIVVVGSALAAGARIVFALRNPDLAGFMEQGPAQAVAIVLLTLFTIGCMSVTTSLNSQRLELELMGSEQRLQGEQAALERANRELAELASQDGLTGLHNRRSFDETLDREWRRLARTRAPLSLVMLDIDHFKEFNDRHGHQQGDHCLIAVAEAVLAAVQRPSDLGARYGGEEFAIILPETASEGAQRVADRVAAAVRDRAIPHDVPSGYLTVSFGVATVVPGAGTVPETLVALADEALYRSKEAGRDQITVAAGAI